MANKELKFGEDLVIVEYAKKDRLGNQIDTTYVTGFTLSLNTGAGGVRPTKFLSVNYTGTDSNNAVFLTLSAASCHGNGSSYMFMEDITIGVNANGAVRVETLQSLRTTCGTYDGTEHFYGDIFYTVDTTNKVVDFYLLCGQYSQIRLTPYKRRNSATAGTITQYTGTATYYSSGTKKYGNNGLIAMTKDIPDISGKLDKSGGDLTGNLYMTGTGSSMASTTTQILFTNSSKSATYATITANQANALGLNGFVSVDGSANVLRPYTGTNADLGISTTPWTNIYGTTIYENGTALSSKYLGISATAANSSKLNNQEASYYLNYNNLTNKPTIPSVGTLNTTATTSQSTSASESLGGSITLHKVAKTGSYDDLLNKPTIPSAVTESTVSGWGFTKNSGTITGITMNGASKGTSGVVDLGTVITSHQSLSSCVKTSGDQSVAGTKTFSSSVNVSATNEIGAGTRAAYFGDGVVYLVGGTNQNLGFPLTGGIIATTDYVDNEIGTAITNVLNANYS